MNVIKYIEVFGDSILKGVQVNPVNNSYHVDNNIGVDSICKKYSVSVLNYSKFGCTIKKGYDSIVRRFQNNRACDMIIMDYGGNDCDYDWKAISEAPLDAHLPRTPLAVFTKTYHDIIGTLRNMNIQPVLTTLPPLMPQRFFEWFCKGLNKDNVLSWLGDVNLIYRFQELYSRTIEKIAHDENVMVVDLRGAFLRNKNLGELICEDGAHPNTEGQKIITATFMEFAEKMRALRLRNAGTGLGGAFA